MTQPDPAAVKVQALIHARLLKLQEDVECGCPMCAAEALMELFPGIAIERVRQSGHDGEWHAPDPQRLGTHTRYVLRTEPEPPEETP